MNSYSRNWNTFTKAWLSQLANNLNVRKNDMEKNATETHESSISFWIQGVSKEVNTPELIGQTVRVTMLRF